MNAKRMKCALGTVVGLAAAFSGFSTWAVSPIARDVELDAIMQKAGQQYVDNFRRSRGHSTQVTVRSWADLEGSLIYIDLGPGALPAQDDGSNEQLEQEVGGLLLHYAYLAGMPQHTQVRVLYQGRPYESYFPYIPGSWGPNTARVSRRAGGLAVVSSSHGQFLHHPGREWRYQRPFLNDVREDLITPAFGDALQGLIEQRSEMTVSRVRSRDLANHEESGEPWWQMAARYHLKALYPEQAEIWNSLPGSTQNDREMLEDIRARPNFANFIQADGLISIHTNGNDSPAVRGVEAYYHRDKLQDRAFADSILCYMKELIRSQVGYEEFPFRGEARPGGHGENGIASMPSVIVEVAYHSNPEDALALQDPVFREASMKGVEKGYRLWREGKGCNPLKVDPIATIRVAAGQSRVVDLGFAGFPQYPVVIETKNVACPPGWKCTDGAVTLPDPDSKPAQITLRCENAGSAPIYWDTRMVDDDGVKSPPVRHIVQCVRGSGVLASPAAHADDGRVATARRLP